MIADTNAASRWKGGSPGGGGHLALKGTAGPRAASPGGGQLTLGWGCPGGGGNLRGGLLTLRYRCGVTGNSVARKFCRATEFPRKICRSTL